MLRAASVPCALLLSLALPLGAAEPPAPATAPAPPVILTPDQIATLPAGCRSLAEEAATATDDPLRALRLLRQAAAAAPPRSPARQLLDTATDQLEERLAVDDADQAAAQARDGHWSYSESFLLQELALRARAAASLHALWADARARAAITDATIEAHQQPLVQGTDPAACRWRLAAALDAATPAPTTPALLETLRLLAEQVGGADADVVRWTGQLLARSAPSASLHLAAPVRALEGTLADARGDHDPLVAALAGRRGPLARAEGLDALGRWVGSLAGDIGIGVYHVSGQVDAAATPSGTSVPPASASSHGGGSGTAGVAHVRWLEERQPDLGRATPVMGAGLRLMELGATVPVPIAGAGVQTGTLTGQTYHGALTIRAIGAEVVGGARMRLEGPGGALTLLVLGTLGADACTTRLGTRPQAVNGSTSAMTASGSGIGWHAGISATLAWRPRLRWEYTASLSAEWLQAPGASSSGSATFLSPSGTGTSPGTEQTQIGRISAIGAAAAIGTAYCW